MEKTNGKVERKKRQKHMYRYLSLVIPLKELLPPDGLLQIVRKKSVSPRGHKAFGLVDYDHKLPSAQRKAYRLEFIGLVSRQEEYPPLPSAKNPNEVREVLKDLHPELYPKPPEPPKPEEPKEPEKPKRPWKPDGPMWLIPGKVLYEPPNNIRRKSHKEDDE